jgi:CubicO group peptidase (beta-lactamase class C family)
MYMLAGHVAERIGGATWEELVKTSLFDQIGMTSTRVLKTLDHVTTPPAARPYILSRNGDLVTNFSTYVYK